MYNFNFAALFYTFIGLIATYTLCYTHLAAPHKPAIGTSLSMRRYVPDHALSWKAMLQQCQDYKVPTCEIHLKLIIEVKEPSAFITVLEAFGTDLPSHVNGIGFSERGI